MTTPLEGTKTLKIRIDEAACTGMRLCQLAAENVFGFDEVKRVAIPPGGPVAADAAVMEAVEGCPMEALTAVDTATGAQVFP